MLVVSGTDSEFNSSVEITKKPRPTSLTQNLFRRDFDSAPNLALHANGGSPSPKRRSVMIGKVLNYELIHVE